MAEHEVPADKPVEMVTVRDTAGGGCAVPRLGVSFADGPTVQVSREVADELVKDERFVIETPGKTTAARPSREASTEAKE